MSFEEPEAAKLFDEAFFLANSILEVAGLFSEAFFLVNSTLEAVKLSFELEATELFKKFYFADPALEAAKLSSEEPCPQVQLIDIETQDPPAEDSRLTKEASHNFSNNSKTTRYIVGPNAARPSDLGVLGATATDTNKEL